MNPKMIFKSIVGEAKRLSPELLTGFGIIGYFIAIGMAIKATPKAMDLITIAEDEKEDELTPKEKVKAAAPAYISTGIAAGFATIAVVGGQKISHDRNVELAAALIGAKELASRYQKKTEELGGKEAVQQVRQEAQTAVLKNNPPNKNEIIETGYGNDLCYDPMSDRYFYCSIRRLEDAELHLNQRMYNGHEIYVTVNDLYDEINLKHTSLGNDNGWSIDDGGIAIDFSDMSYAAAEDGTPCFRLEFKRHFEPKYLR